MAAWAVACASIASLAEAQERAVIRAIGMVSPGIGDDDTTVLPGVGVDVVLRDTMQLFGEYAHEVGHTYPPDPPVYTGPIFEPVVIVIALGVDEHRRTDEVWAGGIRFIVPPDRPVRTFVEFGGGSMRTRRQTDVAIDNQLERWISTRREPYALFGGGFSSELSERMLLTAGYRLCLLSPSGAESWRSLVHAGLGIRF